MEKLVVSAKLYYLMRQRVMHISFSFLDKLMNVKIKGDLEEAKNFCPKDLQDLENDDIGADESRDDEDETNSK